MNEANEKLIGRLRSRFTILSAITAVLFAAVAFIHNGGNTFTPPFFSLKAWGYATFLLAGMGGVAVPILLRIRFQREAVRSRKPTIWGYELLQRNLFLSVYTGSVAAVLGYFFPVQLLYLYGSFFSIIYGIYSVIPYRKRVVGELKFYRLMD